jgi:hypothetical protein
LGERPFGDLNSYGLETVLRNPSEILSRYLPKPRQISSDEAYTHIILRCLTHNVAMRPGFRDLRGRVSNILADRTS